MSCAMSCIPGSGLAEAGRAGRTLLCAWPLALVPLPARLPLGSRSLVMLGLGAESLVAHLSPSHCTRPWHSHAWWHVAGRFVVA